MLRFSHRGNPDLVFGNIARCRDDFLAGRKSNYNPLKIILGGGTGGAAGCGLSGPYVGNGLMKGTKVAFGNSVGSVNVTYAADCDQALETEPDRMKHIMSIFYEECTDRSLVSYLRWFWGGNGLDIDSLCKVFREGPKRINQERVRSCPTEIVTAVSGFETARTRLLRLKTFNDIVDGIRAAIHIPGFCPGSVNLNGEEVVEAGGCEVMPIRQLVGQYGPFTDIVAILNRPEDYRSSWRRRQIEKRYATRGLPGMLRDAILRREEVFARRMHFLVNKCCANVLLIYNEDIDFVEQDPAILRDAVESGEAYMEMLLQRAGV